MPEATENNRRHQSAPKPPPRIVQRFMHVVNRHRYCKSAADIQTGLPLFVPNSGGPPEDLTDLTIQSVRQTMPLLARLAERAGHPALRVLSAEEFCDDVAMPEANELARLFNLHGSDKSDFHNYHLVYGQIAHDLGTLRSVLEIGMGTNNTDVTSHMGAEGKPGASLRAFRDFTPDGQVYGADIDRRILFQEDRIKTFFVDQTEPTTLATLAGEIVGSLDLIIDDGLHSPNANLTVMLFAMDKVRDGGWIVIEDVPERALPLWIVADALMPDGFDRWMIRCQSGYVYVVRKRD